MYTLLDVVGAAERKAKGVAFRDRMRYAPFIEAAERFAAESGLIVGGAAATRLLLGGPDAPPAIVRAPGGEPLGVPSGASIGLDSFQYDFYSGRAAAAARALGDAMYAVAPEGLGHYTTVLTKVADYHFAVSVDGRDLFTVTALPVHRGVKTADVVIPTRRPAQFARGPDGAPVELACMGPEIQLMRLYASLCNPGDSGEWRGLLGPEASLRALFRQEASRKIAKAVARAEGVRVGGSAEQRSGLVRALYDRFAAGPGRVLVGPGALALLAGRAPGAGERMQVVTVASLEAEAQEVAAIARRQGFEAQWRENDPKNPTEPRLRRVTVSLVEGRGGAGRREPFADLYNAAEYELVPYVLAGSLRLRGGEPAGPPATEGGRERRKARGRRVPQRGTQGPPPESGPKGPAPAWAPPAGLKVGTPFALMRFRLADMWTMQVLMSMGAVDAGFAKGVLLGMLAGYEQAAAYYERVLAGAAASPEEAAARLLPLDAYIGRYEDPGLALRRAAQDKPGARFYPPYMPAARRDRAPAVAETAKGPEAEAVEADEADEADGADGADGADETEDSVGKE